MYISVYILPDDELDACATSGYLYLHTFRHPVALTDKDAQMLHMCLIHLVGGNYHLCTYIPRVYAYPPVWD